MTTSAERDINNDEQPVLPRPSDSRNRRSATPAVDPIAEFDGQCAFALSTGKKDVPANEDLFLIQSGRKFNFSNPVARFLWKVLPGRLRKAESTWSAK